MCLRVDLPRLWPNLSLLTENILLAKTTYHEVIFGCIQRNDTACLDCQLCYFLKLLNSLSVLFLVLEKKEKPKKEKKEKKKGGLFSFSFKKSKKRKH